MAANLVENVRVALEGYPIKSLHPWTDLIDLNLWLIIRNTMDPRSGAPAAVVLGGTDGGQELFIIGGHDHHSRDTNSVKKLNLKFADYSSATAPCMNHRRVYASVACA